MIVRDLNRISFSDSFRIGDLLRPISEIHHAKQAGFQEIILDFAECSAAFAPPMVALCVQIMRLRSEEGFDFRLILPTNYNLARLFRNADWAHFIDPNQFDPIGFKGTRQLPATHFSTAAEQKHAVDRTVEVMLGAITNLDRDDLAAFEWSVNELTDNVLIHSGSPVGGLVQVSTFLKDKKCVEYIVADAGLGIPATLRPSHPELKTDVEALESAIREGVTRDRTNYQGNGLFGSFAVCSHSKGTFHLESGYGRLSYTPARKLETKQEKVPFDGTLITAQLNFADPKLLAQALRFRGRQHTVSGTAELKYDLEDRDDVLFVIKDEAASFGNRDAGTTVRNKLRNILQMFPAKLVIIDFSEVPLISSSFADEVIGKLFVQLGPLAFTQRFKFRGTSENIQQLIDRAITQRLRQ
jgi:anti-sigma regulatory factor (Ser/Thr protein kinase)